MVPSLFFLRNKNDNHNCPNRHDRHSRHGLGIAGWKYQVTSTKLEQGGRSFNFKLGSHSSHYQHQHHHSLHYQHCIIISSSGDQQLSGTNPTQPIPTMQCLFHPCKKVSGEGGVVGAHLFHLHWPNKGNRVLVVWKSGRGCSP